MAKLEPVLDAEGVNALLRRAFPQSPQQGFPQVTSVTPGRIRLASPYRPEMLRPGGVIP